jgi:hypothetical protein
MKPYHSDAFDFPPGKVHIGPNLKHKVESCVGAVLVGHGKRTVPNVVTFPLCLVLLTVPSAGSPVMMTWVESKLLTQSFVWHPCDNWLFIA